MKLADVNAVTAAVASWAIERNDIRAMAMLRSWVRGNPRPDSDLDLLLLSELAPDRPRSIFRMQASGTFYGVVWSQHLHLLPAAEVELTFARCS
jgi:hypothetical protein